MSVDIIARALNLRRSGKDYVGACPCCGYKSGFAITENGGKLLAVCHVGKCSWEAIRTALARLGRLPERDREPGPERQVSDTGNKGEWARRLWNRSIPAVLPTGATTLVQDYALSRDITLPLPANVLHFVPDCWHRESNTKAPAMIALIEHQVHGPVAVHRTWLKADGSGKADLDPNKMTLGPRDGGAIRLAPVGPNGELAVGEGIESSLSFMQLTGTPTWSAISAGGIEALILPPEARLITIACDADPVGIKAAHRAARRWLAEGRRVWIAKPPAGRDFNDVLRARRAA